MNASAMTSDRSFARLFNKTLALLLLLASLLLASSSPGVVYVKKGATGAQNGTSWDDAATTIQAGIDLAASPGGDEVWVAQGTYYEAIVMKSGVGLYGGFNGTETDRSERNWNTNVTTIDASTARDGSRAYHVVMMDSITSCTIDGFTITRGWASGIAEAQNYGGGVYCSNLGASVTIVNNTIKGNGAYYGGAGIFCGRASPVINANAIVDNGAGYGGGGGVCCKDESSPLIIANAILDNLAASGGAIYCRDYCSPTLVQNIIAGNQASGYYSRGGAIYVRLHCSMTIQENVILGNSAEFFGGGISCSSASPTIARNAIADNGASFGGGICCERSEPQVLENGITGNAASEGGGIYCFDDSCPSLRGNTISGNTATKGGGIFCDMRSSPPIMNNMISGNKARFGGGIYCVTSSSPTITNNTISENSMTDRGGGIYCIYASAPRIQNCIFANNNSYDIYEDSSNSDPLVSYNDFWGNAHGVYYDEGTTPYSNVTAMEAAIRECSNNVGFDPLFVSDTLPGGAWTASSVYNSETLQSTLVNSSASWTVKEHVGRLLNPDTSQNRSSVIVDNTETTMTLWGDVSWIGHSGDAYKILDYHLQSSSPCIDAGCTVTLTEDFEGDPRPWDATSAPRGDGSHFDIGADEFVGPVKFDFRYMPEGWTTGAAAVFAAPEWSYEAGSVRLVSQNNTNTFGFWQSPQNAIPVTRGNLYRARFVVSTNVTEPSRVPGIRLRVNSSNFQQSEVLGIDSVGDGGASPAPSGTTYDLYFVPPTNEGFCTLAFDLLNFDSSDAPNAEVALEGVLVERFWLDTLTSPTVSGSYDFEASQESWSTGDGQEQFSDPQFSYAGGALHLRATTNTNTFGYWHSNAEDITLEANRLYRGTFDVRTDVTSKRAVPQMRLRFNMANLQASRTLGVESIGDGANSPGTTNTTYDNLYFLPPANCVGNCLIVSFDMLNFSPDDAPTGSLILDHATIESLNPPATP